MLFDEKDFGMSRDDFIYSLYYDYGIKVGTHYQALHLTRAFRTRGFTQGQFPYAEKVSQSIVTLPVNPAQSEEAREYLLSSIKELAAGRRRS
jgi:perosamine synthetase